MLRHANEITYVMYGGDDDELLVGPASSCCEPAPPVPLLLVAFLERALFRVGNGSERGWVCLCGGHARAVSAWAAPCHCQQCARGS